MFLFMGITLAIASTYIEIKLVHGSKVIDRLYTEGLKIGSNKIEGVYFNTFGSFALSWFIGMMFAADGLTVLFGGMLSTGMSQAYFSWEKYARSMGWSWTGVKRAIATANNNVRNAKSSLVKTYRDFEQPLKDLRRGILIFLRAISMPFVLLRRWSKWYSERRVANV